MKIILSPAKKMVREEEFLRPESQPAFLEQTEVLMKLLKSMNYAQLKQTWKCSDKLVEENMERLEQMDLYHHLTPALFSYEGIAYQYMAPTVFTADAISYTKEHLRILSGFYGVLKPMDGVTPYRLEMISKLAIGTCRDLYQFWGSRLADYLCRETDLIINLASKEYSRAVTPYLSADTRMLTCQFVQNRNGKLVEQSTACKMARGDMVRFMAENGITRPEELKSYDRLFYRYAPEKSGESTYVFVKEDI